MFPIDEGVSSHGFGISFLDLVNPTPWNHNPYSLQTLYPGPLKKPCKMTPDFLTH